MAENAYPSSVRTSNPRAPAVLMVSPDPVRRDELVEALRRHLGGSCRVIGAAGVREASDVLTHLTIEGTAVSLVICPLRLPDGSGVELFGHIAIASPATRRVLLTTMDQADAALQAINQSQVDRYLVLPAEPLEERLLPIVDDLLTDWFGQHSAAQVGVTVLGHRFAPKSYVVKDYLARSLVPFTWFDLSDDPEAHALARDLNRPNPAPTTVLFDDGRALYDPTVAELATALGLTEEATRDRYDLVVVGGGPAGLAAAVYGACEGMSVVVACDELGFVLTDTEVSLRPELLPMPWPLDRPPLLTESSIPSVFAAGDVRAGSIKRISSAVGQGAVAVAAIIQYLDSLTDVDED